MNGLDAIVNSTNIGLTGGIFVISLVIALFIIMLSRLVGGLRSQV